MRNSILQDVYILADKEDVDCWRKVSWYCLDDDYEFNDTYNSLRTISLKRV